MNDTKETKTGMLPEYELLIKCAWAGCEGPQRRTHGHGRVWSLIEM